MKPALALVILMLSASVHAFEGERAGGELSLRYDERTESVTLRARDVPLSEILDFLQQQAGILLTLDDNADQRRSLEMSGVKLEPALKRLAGDLGTIARYRADEQGGKRLVGMHFLPREAADSRFLPSGAAANRVAAAGPGADAAARRREALRALLPPAARERLAPAWRARERAREESRERFQAARAATRERLDALAASAAEREATLRQSDPERYALREARRAANR